MQTLPRIKGLKIPRIAQDAEHLPLAPSSPTKIEEADPYAVYPPFMSRLEVAVWQVISKFNPYWELQVQQGRPGTRGSTRVDFLNRMLMVALYPDGEYWHRYRTAQNIYARARLKAQGYRVVQWLVNETVEEFVPKIAGLYLATVGR